MTRALFLDRDGTLIVDTGYPRDPALVTLIPGALEALRELQADFALVIISNQSGIGRGIISPDQAAAVHARVVELFAAGGVTFADAFYCPHLPDAGCRCRKPAPGLLEDAIAKHGFDRALSIMVGDKELDVAAGRAAGLGLSVQFGGDWPEVVRAARAAGR